MGQCAYVCVWCRGIGYGRKCPGATSVVGGGLVLVPKRDAGKAGEEAARHMVGCLLTPHLFFPRDALQTRHVYSIGLGESRWEGRVLVW
jgi:hypothetical protein